MALNKYKIGQLIDQIQDINDELLYGEEDVKGMTITKEIIPTKADTSNADLKKYIIVRPNEFVYNPRTHGKKIGLGFNNTQKAIIISWNNIGFRIKKEKLNTLDPYYLFINFNRNEWDREACYQSWGSSTEIFTWNAFCDMEIELPSMEIQKKYVAIYKSMLENQKNYENGLEDLKLNYGEELAQKILNSLYKISILEEIRADNKKLKDFIKIEKIMNKDLEKISNKKQYLQDLANEKKKINREIKRIDEIMSDTQALRKEFMEGNLRREKKIFSLSDYTDLLQDRREKLFAKLKKCSKLMEPFTYVQMKLKLDENVKLFKELNLNEYNENQIFMEMVNFQKNFFKAFNKTLKKIETKKDVLEKIFVFRYYKLIPINKEDLIKDIGELKADIKKAEKYLITKACNLRART